MIIFIIYLCILLSHTYVTSKNPKKSYHLEKNFSRTISTFDNFSSTSISRPTIPISRTAGNKYKNRISQNRAVHALRFIFSQIPLHTSRHGRVSLPAKSKEKSPCHMVFMPLSIKPCLAAIWTKICATLTRSDRHL